MKKVKKFLVVVSVINLIVGLVSIIAVLIFIPFLVNHIKTNTEAQKQHETQNSIVENAAIDFYNSVRQHDDENSKRSETESNSENADDSENFRYSGITKDAPIPFTKKGHLTRMAEI